MWNVKKLGESIDADFDVFKRHSAMTAICKGERTTTAGLVRVKESSKSLQGTIVRNKVDNYICWLE